MNRFIAGNTLKSAIAYSQQVMKIGKKPIINYAVEYPKNKRQMNKIYNEYVKMSEQLDSQYKVLLKLSSLTFKGDKIHDIVKLFTDKNIKVIIDAEENENNDIYHKITNNLLLDYNKETCNVIKTYQMYRKDALCNLKHDLNYFNENRLIIGTKLVKGAYWNSKHKQGHLINNKKDTDTSYNNGIIEIFNYRHFSKEAENIIATHNLHFINFAIKLNNYNYQTGSLFKFSHLMGMNNIKYENINKLNKVLVYIPYGPYLNTLPYLSKSLYDNMDTLKYMQYN